MTRMTTAAWTCVQLVALLAAASVAVATAPQRVAVRASPVFAQAPATLRIDVTVEPDDRNRALVVVVDSGEYFRSSAIPLEGAQAARFHTVEYASVPEGAYIVQAEVHGAGGDSGAAGQARVRVLPRLP